LKIKGLKPMANKIYISNVKDPWINLTFENCILNEIQDDELHLLMWVNDPCIVMGRFQNPWIECNLNQMKKDGIHLVRRQSGGGTVYHDGGNVNFSFITSRKKHNKKINHAIILEALTALGVDAISTPRGDIIIEDEGPKKISGSAFKQKKDTAFHHGTMLIQSNLTELNNYLNSSKQNLESKSIASVRSTVMNISEVNQSITPSIFMDEVANAFKSYHRGNADLKILKDETDSKWDIQEQITTLGSWKWVIGETPKFFVEESIALKGNDHDDCEVSINMTIKKAKIEEIDIECITIHPSFILSIEDELLYSLVQLESINQCFAKLGVSEDMYSSELNELKEWFISYFAL